MSERWVKATWIWTETHARPNRNMTFWVNMATITSMCYDYDDGNKPGKLILVHVNGNRTTVEEPIEHFLP
jgi:hypothetical protein